MYFANPLYFLLVSLIAFVVLLYFFRKQYTAVQSPSNLLWRQVMNEWNASPWLQKLQHNLLFLLQLAALMLAMLALAGPVFMSDGLRGQQQIWIVDTSASMSASKENKLLLDHAKEQMLEMVGHLNGQEVTILMAGAKPEILLNKETDTSIIKRTIKKLTVMYDHENIAKAIQLANSFAVANTSIHVFSDSAQKVELNGIKSDQYIEVHNVQRSKDNFSLLSFGVAENDNGVSGLALIENQGSKIKSVPFTVANEGHVLFQTMVTVPAGEQVAIDIPNLPVRMYYQATINLEDHYKIDNQMTALFTELKPKVYGAGEINPFFIKGLRTLGMEAIQIDQDSLAKITDGIILAEGIPLSKLPDRPVIYVNKSKEQIELTESIKSNVSPLTNFVDFEKTYIKYASTQLSGNWNSVVSSGKYPLIQTGRRNGQPIVILNFSLENSDWPLHPGFPIFLYNSYQWLSKQSGFLGYFQPGEEKSLQLEGKNDFMEIYTDSGHNIRSFQLNKESFQAPHKPGIYQALSGDQVYYFSVLLDDREKKIKSHPSFIINNQKSSNQDVIQKPNESLSFWLTLAMLLILMGEWEVYRRGFRA